MAVFILFFIVFFSTSNYAQVINFSDKQFNTPIDEMFWRNNPITGVQTEGTSDPIFHLPVDFTGSKFDSMVQFTRAVFESTASFTHIKFKSKADFRRARFHSSAFFNWTNFYSKVDFHFSNFDSGAYFGFATFHDTANFTGASLSPTARFTRTKFNSIVNFTRSRFDSSARFDYTTFDSTADFSGAMFSKYSKADFRGSRFGNRALFVNTTLPDTLHFSLVTEIAREIDFTLAKPPLSNRRCKISLAGSDLSKIKLNMKLFELFFPDTVIDSVTYGLPTVLIDNDQKASVYEEVLKKLKDDGFMESYKILDIQYKQFKYKHKGMKGCLWNILDRFWWNYGYDKNWILLWTSFFWLSFFIVNLCIYSTLSEKVYRIDSLEDMHKIQENDSIGSKRRVSQILRTAIYTSIIFFGLKMDLAKFRKGVIKKHPWWLFYVIVIYAIGIVCIGFTANYVFKL